MASSYRLLSDSSEPENTALNNIRQAIAPNNNMTNNRNYPLLDSSNDLLLINNQVNDQVNNNQAHNNQANEVNEQVNLSLPGPSGNQLLDLDTIIKKSNIFVGKSGNVDSVVKEFNRIGTIYQRPSIMMASDVLGKRINRNEYRLVARNNQPELVPFSEQKMYKKPSLTGTTEELGIFLQTELCFGAYGSYVVNIPPGSIAKVWYGNDAAFLGEGIHVIHDQNFRMVKKEHLFSINDKYTRHGIYHIINIPKGTMAKAWLGTKPIFLKYQDVPYIFKDATFRIDEKLIDMNGLDYVNHGTIHILLIPQGKVAKVWFGTKPVILESKSEPYIFDDPNFKLSPKNVNVNVNANGPVNGQANITYFEDSFAEVILHGSIKRLMPKTGTVAITYNNGTLVTYGPSRANEPIIINSPNHSFDGFLSTNTQTIEFPSNKTKEERRAEIGEQNLRPEDIIYEIFRTSDGLPIGVKLLVVYEIYDADACLRKLNKDQILPHIENIVVADMGMVIQSCSSSDFLKSNQTQARSSKMPVSGDIGNVAPSAPEFYEHLQDEVKNKLHNDFNEYGIKMVRLNIETPKILDKNIADKMAELSLMNSTARAKESTLERNYNIALQEANQNAKTTEIQQLQKNSNKISEAEAELQASRMRAEALKIEAQASAIAKLASAEVEAKAQQMLLDLAKQRGQLYLDYPDLLQYDLAQIQSAGFKGISTMVISPEVAASYYGIGSYPIIGEFKNKSKE